MKKVLLLVHEYYPCGSAITNCLAPIIEEMKNQQINVDIITRRQKKELKKIEIIDNIKVYRINDWFNILYNEINNSKSKLKKILLKIALKLVWIYRTKINIIREGFLNLNKAYNFSKNLFECNKYDALISCSYPFNIHEIGYKLKKYYTFTWCVYQFDPHTYNHTLNDENNINRRLKEELEILSRADKIFLPEENYKENISKELKDLKEKYYVIPFALIKKPINEIKPVKSKKIIFTFAGTLYENVRTPFDMLEFFKNIDFDYEINLYCIIEKVLENKLQEYKSIFGEKLNIYRNEPKEVCDKAMINSNILLTIGNEMNNQTPSKLFELISMGKPIINFYSINDDTSKKVLSDYPLGLNIYKKYNEKDIEKFNKFCLENQNKIITYEEAVQNYKTASDVAKEFIEEVSNCCGNK